MDHSWLRIYEHEISRRQRIAREKPRAFQKVFGKNPKGLSECCKGAHVWVPATHLWIHDGARGGVKIDGFQRRAFNEASPYYKDDFLYQPQICWNCVKTRTRVNEVIPQAKRRQLKEHLQSEYNKPKRRGRKGGGVVLEDISELFDETV